MGGCCGQHKTGSGPATNSHGYGSVIANSPLGPAELQGPCFEISCLVQGAKIALSVRAGELVVRIKAHLYEQWLSGTLAGTSEVPPPVASRVYFSDTLLPDTSAIGSCGIVEGAEVVVEYDAGIPINIQGSSRSPSSPDVASIWPVAVTVWLQEPVGEMLCRVLHDETRVDVDTLLGSQWVLLPSQSSVMVQSQQLTMLMTLGDALITPNAIVAIAKPSKLGYKRQW